VQCYKKDKGTKLQPDTSIPKSNISQILRKVWWCEKVKPCALEWSSLTSFISNL